MVRTLLHSTRNVNCFQLQPQNNIYYYVVSIGVYNIVEGRAVFGVFQTVLRGPIETASGCNSNHCTQTNKPDL